MKKFTAGLLLTLLLVTFPYIAYAKPNRHGKSPGKSHYAPGHQKIRNDAGYIIHRSAEVVFSAQRAADHGHHYRGLSLAIAHQRKARKLYLKGSYRDAINHSLRARDLAFEVIAANRKRPRKEYYCDKMEVSYRQKAPRGRELDFSIETIKVGNDKDLVRLHFGLDITK